MTAFLGAAAAASLAATGAANLPEPASWAMLILGIVVVSSSMRRRATAHVSFV